MREELDFVQPKESLWCSTRLWKEGLGGQGFFLHKRGWGVSTAIEPQFVENTEPAFSQTCPGKDIGQWTQAAASEISSRCKETMFHYEGSGSGAEKVCGISIFADTQCLTKKGPEQPGFKLGLPGQWVRLGDLLRFRVNYPVHRQSFISSARVSEEAVWAQRLKKHQNSGAFLLLLLLI